LAHFDQLQLAPNVVRYRLKLIRSVSLVIEAAKRLARSIWLRRLSASDMATSPWLDFAIAAQSASLG
jgi:hypothetical protein